MVWIQTFFLIVLEQSLIIKLVVLVIFFCFFNLAWFIFHFKYIYFCFNLACFSFVFFLNFACHGFSFKFTIFLVFSFFSHYMSIYLLLICLFLYLNIDKIFSRLHNTNSRSNNFLKTVEFHSSLKCFSFSYSIQTKLSVQFAFWCYKINTQLDAGNNP